MDCLNNIVGIIETPTVELPNITTSDSGLWLEDTSAGRVPLKAAFYNDTTRIEGIIPDAVKDALKALRIESDQRLTKMYTDVHSTIGFPLDYTGFLPASGDLYYLYLNPKEIKGAVIRIKEIKIHTTEGLFTGTFNIYKDDTLIFKDIVANFNPITLDLDGIITISYLGNPPKNFKHTSCCGRYPTHTGYVSVGSGTVSQMPGDLPLRQNLPNSVYNNGIEVVCTFDCDPYSFLCDLDFERTTFGMTFAKLVQQIARKNIIYWLISNNKVTAFATCKEDQLNGILEYLIDDIETMLRFLPENYDHSDCYTCNGIYKGEIEV